MTTQIHNTPAGVNEEARTNPALWDVLLATAALTVMVGAIITVAQPETLHGSVPVVVEASR